MFEVLIGLYWNCNIKSLIMKVNLTVNHGCRFFNYDASLHLEEAKNGCNYPRPMHLSN